MRHGALKLSTLVTRAQPRVADQRSEPRHEGVVEAGTLYFRGTEQRVPVINLSSRGTMIESGIAPRLGESVVIAFDGCSPMHAFVRWVRDGRIGLNFGGEIVLGF